MKVFVIFAFFVAVALAKPSGLGGYEFIGYNGYPAPFNYHAQQPLLLTSSKGWENFVPAPFGQETNLNKDVVMKEESKKPKPEDVKEEEESSDDDESGESDDEEMEEPKKETLEVSKKEKKDMSEKKEELLYKKVLVAPSYTSLPAPYPTKISYGSLPVGHTTKLVYSSLPVSTHSYVAPKVAYAPISSSYVPHAPVAIQGSGPWASAPVTHATVQGHGPWASAPVAKYEVPTYSKFKYSIHEYKPPTYKYVTVKPQTVKVNAGWW